MEINKRLKWSLGERMNDNIVTVSSLYDSHVHWLMTGEKRNYFDLQGFTKLTDISPSQFEKKNFRGDWLFGFGWDDSQLSEGSSLSAIDRLSSTFPICFIKRDAHSCLLNSVALDRVLKSIESQPTLSAYVERDQLQRPTGILKESAFYGIYPQLPPLEDAQVKSCLRSAQDYFLSKGFTHVRDMTCSLQQWNILTKMHEDGELRLFADINFNVESVSHARDQVLPFVLNQRRLSFSHLKIQGLKIFADGSLGSRSALLSENYLGSDQCGQSLWSDQDIYIVMKMCWENDLEFSVHTLGDRAVDKVVDIGRTLYSEKVRGYLNLEHVQLILPETITKMKSLYVRCHMQPSHWLSDKKFLKDRLSPLSMSHLFPWEALRRAKVPISFGSDAPIEESDVELTFQGLRDSARSGIEEFRGDFFEFYRHPSPTPLGRQAITMIQDRKPIKVELPQVHTES